MANTRRNLIGLAAGGILLLMGRPIAADKPLMIAVDVTNLADITVEDLEFAERQVATVYAAIGVHLLWVVHGEAVALPVNGAFALRLVLLSRKLAENIATENIKHDVLGLSVPPAKVAYVFSSRILMTTSRRGMSFANGLSQVMAHELGHLLLPGQGHTLVGAMCQSVLCSSRGDSFSKDQSASIRALVTEAAR